MGKFVAPIIETAPSLIEDLSCPARTTHSIVLIASFSGWAAWENLDEKLGNPIHCDGNLAMINCESVVHADETRKQIEDLKLSNLKWTRAVPAAWFSYDSNAPLLEPYTQYGLNFEGAKEVLYEYLGVSDLQNDELVFLRKIVQETTSKHVLHLIGCYSQSHLDHARIEPAKEAVIQFLFQMHGIDPQETFLELNRTGNDRSMQRGPSEKFIDLIRNARSASCLL